MIYDLGSLLSSGDNWKVRTHPANWRHPLKLSKDDYIQPAGCWKSMKENNHIFVLFESVCFSITHSLYITIEHSADPLSTQIKQGSPQKTLWTRPKSYRPQKDFTWTVQCNLICWDEKLPIPDKTLMKFLFRNSVTFATANVWNQVDMEVCGRLTKRGRFCHS